MKRLLLLMTFGLYFFLLSFHAWSKDITYDRGAAITYVRNHCGTSESTKYNFDQYKCYDGAKPECRADNPWLTEPMNVDCANFLPFLDKINTFEDLVPGNKGTLWFDIHKIELLDSLVVK